MLLWARHAPSRRRHTPRRHQPPPLREPCCSYTVVLSGVRATVPGRPACVVPCWSHSHAPGRPQAVSRPCPQPVDKRVDNRRLRLAPSQRSPHLCAALWRTTSMCFHTLIHRCGGMTGMCFPRTHRREKTCGQMFTRTWARNGPARHGRGRARVDSGLSSPAPWRPPGPGARAPRPPAPTPPRPCAAHAGPRRTEPTPPHL